MSNYSNNQNMFTFIIDKVDEKTLIPVFDIDLDFSQNEEYFREDTISLGFKNESERCSKELYDRFKDNSKNQNQLLCQMVGKLPCYNNGQQSFILGNENHSGDYATQVVLVSKKIQVLVIAYIG